MDGQDQHHHPQFNPVFILLLGVMAGALVAATYQCLITCSRQSNTTTTTTTTTTITSNQPNGQQQGLQITNFHNDSRLPTSTSNSMVTSSRSLNLVNKYKKERSSSDEGVCAVCLSEFKEAEAIRVLPYCMHVFHVECIDKWLNLHSNCPICRAETAVMSTSQNVVLSMPPL
ncbi:putative Ring finger protein [Quillaja saponaria]|uniref:RING-type E3 ubiquitin transferase n=1 Tax=Quillaja saponaria TaxID=32244 RepID=A0AAD7LNJ3_QUISA|nr:putative Ring finger protein [Quillaja saponaria]